MSKIGNELAPLIIWSVQGLVIDTYEKAFNKALEGQYIKQDFPKDDRKGASDGVALLFNALRESHINNFPVLKNNTTQIYRILLKYPNFPRILKKIIRWKYKSNLVIPNWLDLEDFYAAVNGFKYKIKHSSIGKINCFKKEHANIPRAWELNMKGISQVEIGRKLFPNINEKTAAVRVHKLLGQAHKMIHGKRKPYTKAEKLEVLNRYFSKKRTKEHLKACEECQHGLIKNKNISDVKCDKYKHIFAFANQDHSYQREKLDTCNPVDHENNDSE